MPVSPSLLTTKFLPLLLKPLGVSVPIPTLPELSTVTCPVVVVLPFGLKRTVPPLPDVLSVAFESLDVKLFQCQLLKHYELLKYFR